MFSVVAAFSEIFVQGRSRIESIFYELLNIIKLNVELSLAFALEIRDESMAACDEHEVPADQRLLNEGRLDFRGPVEVCVQNFSSIFI